jgi:predicted metal-dependent phosphoesterase TrpH
VNDDHPTKTGHGSDKKGAMKMIGDFHIHSKYSHDSIMEPRLILKQARKKRMDTIAITDHDTIKGATVAKKFEKEFGIRVIVGSEIKTDAGDVIGLELKEEIVSRDWNDVIAEIRDQGGISVLPHPFRNHVHIQQIADAIDMIEIWNGRSSEQQNSQAGSLCADRKRCIMGSDAHTVFEVGNVIIELGDDFKGIKNVLRTKYSNGLQKLESRAIRRLTAPLR